MVETETHLEQNHRDGTGSGACLDARFHSVWEQEEIKRKAEVSRTLCV